MPLQENPLPDALALSSATLLLHPESGKLQMSHDEMEVVVSAIVEIRWTVTLYWDFFCILWGRPDNAQLSVPGAF